MKTENIKNMLLYHGTNVSGIKTLIKAEESTIGQGIYLTSRKSDALNYAVRRTKHRGGSPTIYSVILRDVKLVKLTDPATFREVMRGFENILIKYRKSDLVWWQNSTIDATIERIRNGCTNLKEMVSPHQKLFTAYLISLGFDGLIAFEGGEGDFGEHDSWIIFNPNHTHIFQEIKV